ncbi:MAG: C39 family peptidase, partial [Nitrospirota bacterium]
FCVVILTGFTGCMASVPATFTYSHPFYVRDVPFYPGEDYQCGPSVLASVLNNLGYDIEPEDISREIYLRNVKGTLNIDMVSFARRFEDITVTEFYGDLTLLRENLSMGYPLIVFVDLGIWSIRKGHYMLVVGYDDSIGGVIVYSGAEKDKVVRYKDFMRMWERGGYWALRIAKE